MESSESKWITIYTNPESYKVALMEGLLESAGIPCRDISSKDSSYHIGSHSIQVPESYQNRAREIVEESLL